MRREYSTTMGRGSQKHKMSGGYECVLDDVAKFRSSGEVCYVGVVWLLDVSLLGE